MSNKKLIFCSTLFIYLITLLVHILFLQLEDARAFLGITMAIPLLTVFAYQKLFVKQPFIHTLGLSWPGWLPLFISVVFPILLGVALHGIMLMFRLAFLFQKGSEVVVLLVIGLTISSLSALLEEVVWRGNFHYYLRKNNSLPKTALLTAVIWSIWHLPVGIWYKGFENGLAGIIPYMALLFLLSVLLTYTREISKSVVPAAILHGMFNVFYLSDGLQQEWSPEIMEWIKLSLLTVAFALLALLYRRIKRGGG